MSGELETKVKLTIYDITAETGRVPNSLEVARKIDINEADVLDAFARLHARRLLITEPSNSSRIRMAPPFSGIATAFPVEANGKRYYANCVWDAYGIAAALHADAIISASDGHTGEPLTLEVKNGHRFFTLMSRISPFPPRSGGMTSCSAERRCSSSGRKKGSTLGVKRAASREDRWSLSRNSGNWRCIGMRIA
jgi:hypothetical protein